MTASLPSLPATKVAPDATPYSRVIKARDNAVTSDPAQSHRVPPRNSGHGIAHDPNHRDRRQSTNVAWAGALQNALSAPPAQAPVAPAPLPGNASGRSQSPAKHGGGISVPSTLQAEDPGHAHGDQLQALSAKDGGAPTFTRVSARGQDRVALETQAQAPETDGGRAARTPDVQQRGALIAGSHLAADAMTAMHANGSATGIGKSGDSPVLDSRAGDSKSSVSSVSLVADLGQRAHDYQGRVLQTDATGLSGMKAVGHAVSRREDVASGGAFGAGGTSGGFPGLLPGDSLTGGPGVANGADAGNSGASGTLAAATLHGLATQISGLHQARVGHADIRLDPPSLGMVNVHVQMNGQNQMQVSFIAAQSATAQSLQNSLSQLAQAVSQHGVTLTHAQVQSADGSTFSGTAGGSAFGHPAGGQTGQDAGQGTGQGSGQGLSARATYAEFTGRPTTTMNPATTEPRAESGVVGGVSTYA